MRHIYVLRHAKSAWPDGVADEDRPLNDRGRRDARALADKMQMEDMKPGYVLCSSANRTRQTFEPIHKHWPDLPVSFEERLYLASTGMLYEALKGVEPQYQSILIIGHNPGMQSLVPFLAGQGEAEAQQKLMAGYKTGGLSTIRCDCDSWDQLMPGENYLEAVVYGKELA